MQREFGKGLQSGLEVDVASSVPRGYFQPLFVLSTRGMQVRCEYMLDSFQSSHALSTDKTGERFFHISGWWWGVIIGYIIGTTTMSVGGRYVAMFLMAAGYSGRLRFPTHDLRHDHLNCFQDLLLPRSGSQMLFQGRLQRERLLSPSSTDSATWETCKVTPLLSEH